MAIPTYSNGIANVQHEGDIILIESTFEDSRGKEVVATVAYTRHAAQLLMAMISRASPWVAPDGKVVPMKASKL